MSFVKVIKASEKHTSRQYRMGTVQPYIWSHTVEKWINLQTGEALKSSDFDYCDSLKDKFCETGDQIIITV